MFLKKFCLEFFMDEIINQEINIERKKGSLGVFGKKVRKNPWIISTVVISLFAVYLLASSLFGGVCGKVISEDDAGKDLVSYLNGITPTEVTLKEVKEDGSLYEVSIEYQGQTIPLYLTKDGKYFIQGSLVDITETQETPVNPETEPQEVTKSDYPVVDLFIMTHCPYGTQAEKGFIPAIKELGNSVDATIRFVHYFMHGEEEETETYRQVCIREEQSDKFIPYLECFLEDGDGSRCEAEVGVDTSKVASCVSSGKGEEYYAVDSALSEEYGVRGSPTVIVNGGVVSSSRSPAGMLSAICSGFNTEDSSCLTELDSASPSAGFGYDSGAATQAQC
jgi:protein-disulfide isomerase